MLVAVVMMPLATFAGESTLKLKDGRVLKGEVIKEVEGGYYQFKYKIGEMVKTELFGPGEISELIRDPGDAKPADKPEEQGVEPAQVEASKDVAAETPSDAPAIVTRSGVKRGAVISLGEGGDKNMVGQYMTADILRQSIKELKRDKVDIVVFLVNSGGGAASEVPKLADLIQNEFKKEFRVVSWIRSAISAAAMATHCIEEIYFFPEGNYGACTAWHGDLIAAKGFQVELYLEMMRKYSAYGQHDPKIMRSMQIMDPLSATIDPNGDVTWFQDESSGTDIVNKNGLVLSFTAQTAERFKFSRGTASSLEELEKLMGLQEVEWVGRKRAGVPYPVSRAEDVQRAYRDKVFVDSRQLNDYFKEFGASLQQAAGAPDKEIRLRLLARAEQNLNKIVGMVKTNPNAMGMALGFPDEEAYAEWLEKQREAIKEIRNRKDGQQPPR